MPVGIPPEIAGRSFVNYSADGGKISGDVVLESVFADVTKEFLHPRDLHDSRTAKSFQRVVREVTNADVAADSAGAVVGGKACVAHGAGLNATNTSPESIVLSDGTGNDFLEVHFDVTEEMLGQVAAVEADVFVGIATVVIVPIQQGTGRFRSQTEAMHAEHAANVYFASARKQVVAHHAHNRAGHDAEIFLDRGPALHGANVHAGRAHPLVDDRAKFRHLQQGHLRHSGGGHVFLNGLQLAHGVLVVIFHPADAPQDFGEIQRLNGNAGGFEQFFAVPDGIKRRGPRANGPNAQIPQPVYDPANAGEPGQISFELFRIRSHRVLGGQRVGNAILLEVVAGRHLSAKTVAAMRDGHFRGRVRRSLHQHRHIQSGEPQGICDSAFIAKVRQRNNYAVYALAGRAKQCSATFGFFMCLYGTVFAVLRAQNDHVNSGGLQNLDHLFPAAHCQMIGKKSAIADYETKSNFFAHSYKCSLTGFVWAGTALHIGRPRLSTGSLLLLQRK